MVDGGHKPQDTAESTGWQKLEEKTDENWNIVKFCFLMEKNVHIIVQWESILWETFDNKVQLLLFILTFLTPNFNIVKFHTWIKIAGLRLGEKCWGWRGGTALRMIKQPYSVDEGCGGRWSDLFQEDAHRTSDDAPAVRLHDPQCEITRFKLTPCGRVRGSAEAHSHLDASINLIWINYSRSTIHR